MLTGQYEAAAKKWGMALRRSTSKLPGSPPSFSAWLRSPSSCCPLGEATMIAYLLLTSERDEEGAAMVYFSLLGLVLSLASIHAFGV